MKMSIKPGWHVTKPTEEALTQKHEYTKVVSERVW